MYEDILDFRKYTKPFGNKRTLILQLILKFFRKIAQVHRSTRTHSHTHTHTQINPKRRKSNKERTRQRDSESKYDKILVIFRESR